MPHRPRVSRETRRLLAAALTALLAIFVLARLRFPDQPATPNPVTPLLSQLTPRARFADLASDIAAALPRVGGLLHAVTVRSLASTSPAGAASVLTALRLRDDVGVVMMPEHGDEVSGLTIIARDRISGLAIIRIASDMTVPPPTPWAPERPGQPRYLMATTTTGRASVLLRPVLIGSLVPVESASWPGPIWELPRHTDLARGSFVFTEEGQLAGMAIDGAGDDTPALVPADTLIAEADRLIASGTGSPGYLGIEVSSLTPSLARATGAESGVVISWVDARVPTLDALSIGDVIEIADGTPVRTALDWRARAGRLAAGQAIALRVRNGGAVRDVRLVAGAPPHRAPRTTLGLGLRRVPEGAEILRVEPGSAAEAATLRAGDVIVQLGGLEAPTPAAVQRAFASAPGGPLLVAITRGDAHHVLTLEKDASARP